MKKIFLLLVATATLSAYAQHYDRTYGMVFPSKNSATVENPASLLLEKGNAIEGLYGFDDSNISAGDSGNFGKYAMGATYYKVGDDSYVYGALGLDLNSSIKLGINAYALTDTMDDVHTDLGLRFGERLSFAIVARDFIEGFEQFVAGIALKTGALIFECDV